MVGQSGTNTSSSKVAILLVLARIPTVKEIPPAVQTKPPDSRRNGIVAPPGEYDGRGPSDNVSCTPLTSVSHEPCR